MPEAWLAALASLADEGEWGIEDVVTSFKSSREKFELWEAIVEAAAERLGIFCWGVGGGKNSSAPRSTTENDAIVAHTGDTKQQQR